MASVQEPSLYRGLLLSSSLCSLISRMTPVLALQFALVWLLSFVAPTLPLIPRKAVEAGIRLPAAVVEMYEDKVWYRGKVKVQTVLAMLHGCSELARCRSKVTLPIYAQHGSEDKSCSISATKSFLAHVSSLDVEFHEVPGGLHDLSHDPATEECTAKIIAFLDRQVAHE